MFANFVSQEQGYVGGDFINGSIEGSFFGCIQLFNANSQGEADVLALKFMLLYALDDKGISGTELGILSCSKFLDTLTHGRNMLCWDLWFV